MCKLRVELFSWTCFAPVRLRIGVNFHLRTQFKSGSNVPKCGTGRVRCLPLSCMQIFQVFGQRHEFWIPQQNIHVYLRVLTCLIVYCAINPKLLDPSIAIDCEIPILQITKMVHALRKMTSTFGVLNQLLTLWDKHSPLSGRTFLICEGQPIGTSIVLIKWERELMQLIKRTQTTAFHR